MRPPVGQPGRTGRPEEQPAPADSLAPSDYSAATSALESDATETTSLPR